MNFRIGRQDGSYLQKTCMSYATKRSAPNRIAYRVAYPCLSLNSVGLKARDKCQTNNKQSMIMIMRIQPICSHLMQASTQRHQSLIKYKLICKSQQAAHTTHIILELHHRINTIRTHPLLGTQHCQFKGV